MNDDILGLVLSGIVFIVLFIISMALRSGRGAWLINLYQFMPKEKKALYNEKALCRASGNLLLAIDFVLIFTVIAALFEIIWLVFLLLAVILLVIVFVTYYTFTNERFRSKS